MSSIRWSVDTDKETIGYTRFYPVSVIEGEVLVKRFEKKGDEIHLKPANKEMASPIIKGKENKKIEIIGKVIALLRTYA